MLKISCIDTNVKVTYSVTLNISITISQQIGDKIAFTGLHLLSRCTTWWFFFFYLKSTRFIVLVYLRTVRRKTVNSKFREYQEDFKNISVRSRWQAAYFLTHAINNCRTSICVPSSLPFSLVSGVYSWKKKKIFITPYVFTRIYYDR